MSAKHEDAYTAGFLAAGEAKDKELRRLRNLLRIRERATEEAFRILFGVWEGQEEIIEDAARTIGHRVYGHEGGWLVEFMERCGWKGWEALDTAREEGCRYERAFGDD